MKSLFNLGFVLLVGGIINGCTGIDDSEISGHLEITPKSGYDSLEFFDVSAKRRFNLHPGKYKINFEYGLIMAKDPKVAIYNDRDVLVGKLSIPFDSFNNDGTFEFYASSSKNTNAFNILGGKRRISLKKNYYAKLNQDCTYEVSYSCPKTEEVTNSDGTKSTRTVYETCTKTEWGTRDEVWIKEDYKIIYRLLFDAYDYMNVAQFKAEGKVLSRDDLFTSEQCD